MEATNAATYKIVHKSYAPLFIYSNIRELLIVSFVRWCLREDLWTKKTEDSQEEIWLESNCFIGWVFFGNQTFKYCYGLLQKNKTLYTVKHKRFCYDHDQTTHCEVYGCVKNEGSFYGCRYCFLRPIKGMCIHEFLWLSNLLIFFVSFVINN